jgi:KTSC domain
MSSVTSDRHTDLKVPPMQTVKSSNIAAIGYDPQTYELHVKFTNGNHYVYRSVNKDTHSAFINSSRSHGKFFAEHVRSKYSYFQHYPAGETA